MYPWGNEMNPGGKAAANTWQGRFPAKDQGEDGYLGTSPVTAFPPNGFGLYDMGGNVWQWSADWYRPDAYATRAQPGAVARNPQGPSDSFDPQEPGAAKRSLRGGSYLCTEQYLRALPGRQPRQVRDQQRHVEPGIPPCAIHFAIERRVALPVVLFPCAALGAQTPRQGSARRRTTGQ